MSGSERSPGQQKNKPKEDLARRLARATARAPAALKDRMQAALDELDEGLPRLTSGEVLNTRITL